MSRIRRMSHVNSSKPLFYILVLLLVFVANME